ncbi:TonB-dependent receptor [Lysobacter fragariae]
MKSLRRQTLAKAIQLSLLITLPAVAAAQDAPAAKATTLDTVTVTGSRIKKADMETQVPVQTLTREDIERTGQSSLGDLIQELTGSGSALNTKVNSSGNSGFPANGDGVGAGSAQVDLRHLGAKRVLVLVDGMRWVNESSASGVGAATDLNTIPLAIVERIEVLQDGASSLYGSDAIAGVVNVITRRNFEGGQVSLNYGEYSEGDGALKGIDLAWGHTTDRTSLFLGLSHTDQDPVRSADRDISATPIQGGSSRVPGGRFIVTDPSNGVTYDLTTNAGLNNPTYTAGLPDCDSGVARTDGFHCFSFGNDAFNYAPYNLVVTPSKRTGLFGQFRFDISDNMSWYVKALVNRRESTNQAAPEPIDLGPGSGNVWNDNVVIAANNPFNPFGFQLDASNIGTIRRRPLEGGPRVFNQEVNTSYLATGVEGVFSAGERNFAWDVNLSYSRNKAEQENRGSYNARHIVEALGPNCGTIAGCVPLDIFGFGTITPAMLAWISPVLHDRSEQKLSQFTANISGDLFNLPAGAVSFATGLEYRKYQGSYDPDPITVAGEYNGVPSSPTSGQYHVNEAYVELNVPLLRDSSFGKRLDLSLAGRYSDYSTFGGEFTPKYGLRWQLTDDFMMRATYSKGFRAPSIGELFGLQSRFDQQLRDPCLISPAGDPATGSAANCTALGVPAGTVQIDPQISVNTGGNPNLDPERSQSFTTGVVWSPWFGNGAKWSEKFDIEATFYRHTVEGAIQAISAQTQLDLCVDTLDPLYCSGITRTAAGQINSFSNFLTNLGSIKTDGWDVNVFWQLPETSVGRFKFSWLNTFVTRYEAVGAAGQRQPQEPGAAQGDPVVSIPEWTSNASLDWRKDRWSASWTVRHISAMTETCLAADPGLYCNADGVTNDLEAVTYNDAQVGYKFNWMKGLQLTAGVNNLFDKDPPVCTSCALNGFDPSTYDIPGGRFWYVRADLRF